MENSDNVCSNIKKGFVQFGDTHHISHIREIIIGTYFTAAGQKYSSNNYTDLWY